MKVAGCFVAAAAGLAGCASDGEWRYGRPGLVSSSDLTDEMIAQCQLTPSDVAMIDLQGHLGNLWGKTCSEIRDYLPAYRERYGDDFDALLKNPAVVGVLPSVEGIQYAVLSIHHPLPVLPSEVVVDAVSGWVAYGEDMVAADYTRGTMAPLDAAGRVVWLEALSPLLSWDAGDAWKDPTPSELNVSVWTGAVVAADDQLYRWKGSKKTPSGFSQVYEAFQSLTGG
jgi:hypothetical protein